MRAKGWMAVLAVAAALSGAAWAGGAKCPPGQKVKLPLAVYDECVNEGKGYFAPSGWMGSTDAIEYDGCCSDNPHSGESCAKFTFSDPKGWGGIAWQNPANNWGDEDGGLDLSGAQELSFWVRGDKGGEVVDFEMGVVGRTQYCWDTTKGHLQHVKLSKEWKPYTIKLGGAKDLSRILTGFVISTKGKKEPVTVYIDDVVYR